MPHFVLGVWEGRMLSIFGIGNKQNIAYSFLNFSFAMGLFLYQYGVDQILTNGIFLGALTILVLYYLTGRFFRNLFKETKSNMK